MDSNYVKFGIVDASGKFTNLGYKYGMYLIINIRKLNRKDKVSVECWCYCSPCYIPDNVYNMNFGYDDDNPLNELGIRWLKHYIRTNDFNPYIYAETMGIDMRDICIPA